MSIPGNPAALDENARIATLQEYQLLDTADEECFDRLTELASEILGVPVCLMSLIDKDRQFFKSSIGLEEPWKSRRETPFTHSFCKLVVEKREPLLVSDSRSDSRVSDNLAIRDMGVIAYLGVPLVAPNGHVLGSFCAIDGKPRQWTDKELYVLKRLAESVMTEIQLRERISRQDSAERRLKLHLAVTQILSSGVDLQSAIKSALALVASELGFSIGELWRENSKNELECIGQWHPPEVSVSGFLAATAQLTFKKGEGLPGRVWRSGKVLWIPDLTKSVNFPRGSAAVADGLQSAFGFPLRTENSLSGALVFYSKERWSFHPELESTLDLIGQQIGAYIERRWIEETSKNRHKLLDAILENLDDGIVACDADGTLTLFNRATREFHGLPPEPIPAVQWAEHYDLFMADGKTRMQVEEIPLLRALSGETVRNIEMIVAPRNRSPRTLVAHGQPIYDAAGSKLGAVVVMHDLTERRKAEASLRKVETLLQVFMCHTPAISFIKDAAGRMLYVNPAMERAFGIPAEEWIGKNDFELWPDSIADGLRRNDLAVLVSGVPRQVIETVPTPDGSAEWLSHKFVIEDPSGQKLLGGVAMNITAQRKAEERLQKIADNVPALIAYIDSQERYQFTNHTCKDWFSLEPSEIIGKTIRETLGKEEYSLIQPFLTDAFSGKRVRFEREFTTAGKRRYVDITLVPDFRRDGSIRGIYANVNDLTEHRVAEEALARSEELFRRLSNLAPIGIFQTDTSGRCTFVNERWCMFTGLSAEEALGDGWARTIAFEDTTVYERWCEAARRKEPFSTEFRFRRADGQTAWAHGQTVPLHDELGDVTGHIGVVRDISLYKQAEEALLQAKELAESANKAKSLFLANMSHEVRTPLHGIIGVSNMLREGSLGTEERHLAETIHASAESLLTVVNDILDFSKIEAGRIELEKVEFVPAELLNQIVQLNAARASAKGLLIEARIDSAVPARLLGDAGRLRQILNNLVGNAIKFSERGTILVRVSNESGATSSIVRFEVRDQGIGIPQHTHQEIFAPFAQADASTTRRFGGTGLGLSICHQLAELMGGQIGVESELGKGSSFWFTAKLPKCEAALPLVAQSRDTAKVGECAGFRVLLAEDSNVNRMVAMHQLRKLGCLTTAVENGQEALDAVQEITFDLILMDCQMPVMDGYTATAEIRRLGLANGARIVAMTANAMAGEREKCLQAGMDDYMSKPFKASQLTELIQKSCAAGSLLPQ